MPRDLVLWLASVGASGFFSWLFTHLYYKKSLRQQSSETERQLALLTKAAQEANATNKTLLKQQRIQDAMAEYRRKGTPVALIDTYSDLNDAEKADLLDTVLVLARGRKAKANKYRKPEG